MTKQEKLQGQLIKNMQNLFQDLSKNQKISTKKFHEIIVKAIFINKTNENYLNPTLIPKFVFMPVIKQTTSTMFIY